MWEQQLCNGQWHLAQRTDIRPSDSEVDSWARLNPCNSNWPPRETENHKFFVKQMVIFFKWNYGNFFDGDWAKRCAIMWISWNDMEWYPTVSEDEDYVLSQFWKGTQWIAIKFWGSLSWDKPTFWYKTWLNR